MAVETVSVSAVRSGQEVRPGFRSDIEGLRGVAVLIVVLYHATFPWIEGGYVGVDVFFVISGYLITRLLIAEFETGAFSVRNFYVRRIRRLIPALLATIAATLLAGLVILSPEHLAGLATSSVFAALSLSNVHFAFSDGYFETTSKIKPLLHTWSLSVEEQFYLVWPFTLWVIFSVAALRRHLFGLIALALVVSLVLSQYWITRNPDQAYFLSPFRAYQLLAGALAVWAERRLSGLGPAAATAIAATGMAFVAGSAVMFQETSPFPGINGAYPALGAFLIIVSGAASPAATGLLSIQPLTWLGQMSYSVYLVHWPIVVYARYLSVDPFTTAEKWALVAASIAGGVLLHHGVEARYRLVGAGKGSGHRWRQAAGVALVSASLVAVSAGIWKGQGLPQRLDSDQNRKAYAESMTFEFLARYGDGVRHEGTGENGARVLIFGDSMMQNYIPALMSLPKIAAADVTLITRGGCPMGFGSLQVVNTSVDGNCRTLRDMVYSESGAYDLVIWSQSWMEYQDRLFRETGEGRVAATGEAIDRWRDVVLDTSSALAARADAFVVVGPQVKVAEVPPILSRIGPVTPLGTIAPALARMHEEGADERARFAAELAALLPESRVVDPKELVCPGDECRFFDGAESYYFDPIHHTRAATPLLAEGLGPIIERQVAW